MRRQYEHSYNYDLAIILLLTGARVCPLQRQMGDDNVPEVFIMMRYPASIGALGEIELEQMFCAIRQVYI